MDPMEQPEPEVPGHYYALQVGSYFLTGYYNVLANQPHLANQFYTDNSSVVRLDCESGQWAFGETMEVINDMMMSMNITKVEVKTANCLESWGAAITLLVAGLVQLKDYPVRKRFVQNIVLAPKKDGYFIFSDIFKFICDEYDDQYHVPDYNCADNMPQADASYTIAETGSDYLDGEPQEIVAPAENHVQQQDPSEYKAVNVIYDETHSEEHMPSFPSSTDVKRDSPLAPHPPSPPTLEEPVEEAPKTYASVLRTKVKSTMGTAESQQAQQLAQQVQTVPVHEKSNLDNNRTVSTPEDEEEFISVYVGNLSPSTSVFDLEKVFQAFGRIKPDGVAIRSRKEAGIFFGFVEFEDMSGIRNALNASPIELNGRLVHVEERRPNCRFPSSRILGRGSELEETCDSHLPLLLVKGNPVQQLPLAQGRVRPLGSIVRSLSLHFCKRLPVTSWSQGNSFTAAPRLPFCLCYLLQKKSEICNCLCLFSLLLGWLIVVSCTAGPGRGRDQAGGRYAGPGRGRDQAGGRYDGEYATRTKGTGHQKKGGRQYDSYY